MNGLEIYNNIGIYSEALGASRHRQIQMLLEKLLSQLNIAISAIENKQIPEKCKRISSANDIVVYLRDCLNFEDTSSIAARLDAIYQHLEKQLFFANASSSVVLLNECITIVNNVKTWWDNVEE